VFRKTERPVALTTAHTDAYKQSYFRNENENENYCKRKKRKRKIWGKPHSNNVPACRGTAMRT